jgi:hypothetical protein
MVMPDAEWCPQCFTSLRIRAAEPERAYDEDRVVTDEVAEDMLVGDVSEGVRRLSAEFDSVSASLAATDAPPAETTAPADLPRLRVPGPGDSLESSFGPPRTKLKVEGVGMGRPTWICPACSEANPLELEICRVCGTPFRTLLQEPEKASQVEPAVAMRRSLMFPGLGHVAVGRVAEGVARATLFLWSVGTALFALSARGSATSGLGPMAPMAIMFVLAAVVVYGLSAVDAQRAADGRPPVLSTRFLLYGAAGLVILSVLSLGLLIMRLS